jgi:Fic family protein
MREFGLWLGSEDSLHPIIKAGLTHIHLVAIHPFWDGNGRTARGLTTLMLQRGGYGFKQLLALENGFANIRDQYFTAVERALGATFEREYDASTWLEFFTSCLLAEALRLTGELTDWHRMMEEWHEKADALGLNFRQVDGLAYAIQMNRITRGDYMEITNASPATASRDLAELVNWGILAAEGRTRSRVYVLQHPSDAKQRSDGGSQQPPAI